MVVSTRRLDQIRDIDTASNTMTCEAGVVLQIADGIHASTPIHLVFVGMPAQAPTIATVIQTRSCALGTPPTARNAPT